VNVSFKFLIKNQMYFCILMLIIKKNFIYNHLTMKYRCLLLIKHSPKSDYIFKMLPTIMMHTNNKDECHL